MADDDKKQRRQDRHRTLERIRRDKTQSLLSDIQAELAKYTGHKQPNDVTLNKSLSHIVANVKRIREMQQEQEGGAREAVDMSISTGEAHVRDVEDDDPEKLALMAVMNCGTPLVILHMHGAILEVNDAMCEALGYETEELKRQTVYVLTAPEDLAELMKTLCSLLAQPEGSSAHQPGVRFVHRQGHTVVFNLDINAHQQGPNPCYTVWATPIDNELAKYLKDDRILLPSSTAPVTPTGVGGQPTMAPAGQQMAAGGGAGGGEPRSVRPPDLTIPNYTHQQQRAVPLMSGMMGGGMMGTPASHQALHTPASTRQWDGTGLTPLPSPTPSMVQQGVPLPSPHGGGMMNPQQPMPSPNYGGFMDNSSSMVHGGQMRGGQQDFMGYGQGGGMQWAQSPGMHGMQGAVTPNMQMQMGMGGMGMGGMQGYSQGYNGHAMKNSSGGHESWGDPTIKDDPLMTDPFM